MLVRSAQSLEYVRVAVAATDEDGEPVDPTTDAVAMAFVTEGTDLDEDTDFVTADWETNSADPDALVYSALVLVGPTPDGDYVPTAGSSVDVYVKVTDTPEAPVERVGTMRFT